MTEPKSQPEMIRRIWLGIKKLNNDKKATNLKNLLSLLSTEQKITSENLENELLKAIDDGFIVNSNKATSLARMLFKIPTLDQARRQSVINDYDRYCYLCHIGENVLKCDTCTRAVHRLCASNDEQEIRRPQDDSVTSTQNSSNTTTNNVIDISDTNSISIEGEVSISDSWLPFVLLKKEPFKVEETESYETKPFFNDDCQFISVVRQAAKRKARDIKENIVVRDETPEPLNNRSEQSATGENLRHSNNIICQNCKLLSESDKNQAPNITVPELNRLLGFLYERIKSWINFGKTGLSKSFWKDLQEIFKVFFLKFPVTLKSIKTKLSMDAYRTLDEFYCDILDFHHCVAILYGAQSKEYYTSQQTKLECSYHISEIRSCHDCYRHSNQLQNLSLYWFTEPCTIRHELVFAKQVGFSYWPAKVLKVVDDDFDVRFFGPKHPRAIVNAKYIKPIDTSIEELKISKKSTGFVKAMEELEIYQQRRLNNFNEDFSNISSDNTSFQLNGSSFLNHDISMNTDSSMNNSNTTTAKSSRNSTNKISLKSISTRNKTKMIHNNIGAINGQIRLPPSLVLSTENTDKTTLIKSLNIDKNCKTALDKIKTELNAIPMSINVRKQILHGVEHEVENLNVTFKTLLRQVKKVDWCYVCGKIGKYYCCYSMFYCSSECQHKHWKEEHINRCQKTTDTNGKQVLM